MILCLEQLIWQFFSFTSLIVKNKKEHKPSDEWRCLTKSTCDMLSLQKGITNWDSQWFRVFFGWQFYFWDFSETKRNKHMFLQRLTLFGSAWFSRTTLDQDPRKVDFQKQIKTTTAVTCFHPNRGGIDMPVKKISVPKSQDNIIKSNQNANACSCLRLVPKPLWCKASPWTNDDYRKKQLKQKMQFLAMGNPPQIQRWWQENDGGT